MSSEYPLNEKYLPHLETYLDEMSGLQKELLVLFSESYRPGVDNFHEALEYAELKYDGEFPDEFDYFYDFCVPLKNYWREFSWSFVGAAVHTAPNVPEPAVRRDDVVEQTVLEQLQYWSANVRSSFYSHPVSWVAGATSIDEGVVNRVLAKVQGELLASEPPEVMYFATSSASEAVEVRGEIGRLVFTNQERAIEEAERLSGGEYEMSILEIVPGEGTMVAPFYRDTMSHPPEEEACVLVSIDGAEVSVVERGLTFE